MTSYFETIKDRYCKACGRRIPFVDNGLYYCSKTVCQEAKRMHARESRNQRYIALSVNEKGGN